MSRITGYGISFDVRETSPLLIDMFCKNIIIFDADMSWPVDVDDKERYLNFW